MANAASTIEIELEIRQAINRLDRLQRELTQSTQSFNKAAQATRKFEGAINKAKAGLVAFFAAISVQKLAQLSDAMTQFENRVKLATNSLVQQLAVQQQLFLVAQKTALPLEDVGQLYSRLRIAAEQLGASQRDLINLTETVGLALKASGTSAASAQGALLQLGQALNSPRVQAEEFNSLIDGMPNLLREVEKQLGLTAGGLKKFVTDGQLSNKKFFDAILASQKALTQQANSSASTIEQANQRVANSFTSLIGAIDDKLGASKFFTGFIDGLASGIDKLSNFLGLTTQATGGGGGGGGGADLDKVIGEETKPTPPNMPSLFLQANIESLAKMLNSNASKTEVQKEINKFRDYYNQTLETAFKEGGYTFTPFPDVYPDDKIIMPLADFIRDDYIPILQMLEGMLAQAPNLTFFDEIREELLEQIRLFTILEENAERTTDAIISGVSGAGPNASRATNIAQSKTVEEAAAKLILSNEKVAKAIDSSFELLFEVLDPFIDLLGDLISAINRLIGALAEGVGNAIENFADSLGIGPDSYYGGGGFIRDIETMGGGSQGGAYQPTASEALQIAAIKDLRDIVDGQDETLNNLLDAARESGNLTGVVELFKQSINNLIPSLVSAPDLQTYTDILDRINENVATGIIGDNLQEVVDYYQDLIDETTGELPRAEAYVAVGTAELIIQELASQISGTGTSVSDFEGISDLVTKTAQEQIDSIHFQNLTAEEQIHFRNEETVAMLNAQKIFIQLIDDEERRADLLTKIAAAEAKQLELYNLQLSELQKLNEEREREARLLAIQNIETGLQGLLRDFERTIEDIGDLVQGLFDQVNDLLFSEFNLASPQEAFAMASDEYQDLLAKAFEPEATEEDIKNLQGFVNEYLSASRDVYKSSSAFQEIFDNVLQDLTKLGISYGFNAPLNAVSGLQKDLETILVDLPEDLQQAVSDLISGLNLAATAFAQQQVEFLTTVNVLPIQLEEGNFDFDLPVVNLGTITANFDTDGFRTAIRGLNDSIVSAVNAFTATIQGAETAVETGGTATAVDPATEAALSGGSTESGEVYIPPTYGPVEELYRQGTALTDNYTPYLGPLNDADFSNIYTNTNAGLYTYADLAKTLQGSLDNLMGVDYTKNTYQYAIGIEQMSDGTLIKAVRFIEDLEAANRHIQQIDFQNSIGSQATAFYTKYGFAQGGLVPDPLDTIPAMLSPGEYILSPETVRRYGVSNLNRLNSGDSAAINATSDPEVKRLLAELIVAVRENDTEVNVYTDMAGQTKAGIEEFRSELRERTRRQGDKFLPARYI